MFPRLFVLKIRQCGGGCILKRMQHQLSNTECEVDYNYQQVKSKSTDGTKKVEPPKGILSSSKKEFGPLHDDDRIFQNLYGRHDWRLLGACRRGDWYRTGDLIEMGPDWFMKQINMSGLRGRGGAGYYAALKWDTMKKVESKESKILILNCGEGEPGTCKDREILRHEPHKIIEGSLLLGIALGCEKAICYVRNRFYNESCNLLFAISEAYNFGLLGADACGTGIKFDIQVQRGDRYICGEETALVNCLMGKMGRPRRKPPYLTEKGYFKHPALVVNCETVSVVPTLLRRGPRWFCCLGRNLNFGTKLFNISGNVKNPCTVEEEMSIPLKMLIEKHAGGVEGGWDNLLAVFPGGISSPLIGADVANDILMDFDCLSASGSELGTGGVIVLNKKCNPVEAMYRCMEFYKHHTCKQCTPCRDGSEWLKEFFGRFADGRAHPKDIDWLSNITTTMTGTICALCDGQVNSVKGLQKHFKKHILENIKKHAKNC